MGDRRPPGRQLPPGRRPSTARSCKHRRRALQGPRRPLRDLERAELEHVALSRQERGEPLPRRSTAPATRRSRPPTRKAKVLFGELAPIGGGRAIAPLKFLRDVTCSKANYKAAKRCTPLKADGFAIHPYQFTSAPHIARRPPDDVPIGGLAAPDERARQARPAQRAARRPARRQMGLYLTEFGYLTEGNRAQKPKVRAAWLALGVQPRAPQPARQAAPAVPARRSARDEVWHSAILHRDGSPQARLRRPREGLRRQPLTAARRAARCSAPETTSGVDRARRRHTKEESREDQGSHAVGDRSRLGDRRARSRRAQAGRGADPLGGGGPLPLRRAPAPRRHRAALPDRRRPRGRRASSRRSARASRA